MNIKNVLVAGLSAGVIMSFVSLTSLADSNGWKKEDGSWRYYTSGTEYITEDWLKDGGKWYYFDEDGYYLCDTWAVIDGKMYCFDTHGAMQTDEWISCGETRLSFDTSEEDILNWRYVGSDGSAYVGWKKVNGQWYYFNEAEGLSDYRDKYANLGLMVYGDYTDDDGNMYHFNRNGIYITDTWYQNKYGFWYYFGSDGKAYEGWHHIKGKWYYFGDDLWGGDFAMRTGRVETYTDKYDVWIFDDNGVLQTGWYSFKKSSVDEKTGEDTWNGDYIWYYSGSNGACYHSQWLNYNGSWYYFNNFGEMVADVQKYYLNGKLYNFDKSGRCTNANNPETVNGWFVVEEGKGDHSYEDRWIYVENGKEYRKQWLGYRGDWYYFEEVQDYDGKTAYTYMVSNDNGHEIDGVYYDFDVNGICLNPGAIKITGWVQDGISWVFYGPDGHKYMDEWLNHSNKWYYFDNKGCMTTGYAHIWDSKTEKYYYYYFNKSGEMVTGWIENGPFWLYADEKTGALCIDEWKNVNGSWYYFEREKMVSGCTNYQIDGKYYDFDSSGRCQNPYSGRVDKLIILMGDYFS